MNIEEVLRALENEEVRYVLIGAVALAAYGPVRATADLDLVPDPDPENLRHLGNVLVDIGARLVSDPAREFDDSLRSELAKGRGLTLETDLGGVDVVQRVPGVPGYSALAEEAGLDSLEP